MMIKLNVLNDQNEVFELTITDPAVQILRVVDSMAGTCSAEIMLSDGDNNYSATLGGFQYETTWEDADIINWVNSELTKYQV